MISTVKPSLMILRILTFLYYDLLSFWSCYKGLSNQVVRVLWLWFFYIFMICLSDYVFDDFIVLSACQLVWQCPPLISLVLIFIKNDCYSSVCLLNIFIMPFFMLFLASIVLSSAFIFLNVSFSCLYVFSSCCWLLIKSSLIFCLSMLSYWFLIPCPSYLAPEVICLAPEVAACWSLFILRSPCSSQPDNEDLSSVRVAPLLVPNVFCLFDPPLFLSVSAISSLISPAVMLLLNSIYLFWSMSAKVMLRSCMISRFVMQGLQRLFFISVINIS